VNAAELRETARRNFWLEGFADYLGLEAGHSANTIEAYLRDLYRLAEFAIGRGIRDPVALTRPVLREFVFELKDLGLSAATIRRHVSAIRTYFGFLLGEGLVREDPSDRLESPRLGRSLPEALSVREVEALLAAPSIEEPLGWRDRALLELIRRGTVSPNSGLALRIRAVERLVAGAGGEGTPGADRAQRPGAVSVYHLRSASSAAAGPPACSSARGELS
jgi:integrase/recombinase XerD